MEWQSQSRDVARDPRIDRYIADRAAFARPILSWLRERIHAACPEAEETIRWGMPSFSLDGRPLAHMAAFKAHATFGIWHRLAANAGGERAGEAMGQYGRIASLTDLPDAGTIEDHIRAGAAALREDVPTRRSARQAREVTVPPVLADALAADPTASAAFHAFPPSCRREYCDWVAEAKREDTRARRVEQAVAMLREGKRRNWKYEAS